MSLRRATVAAALAVFAVYGGLLASLAWFLDPSALCATLTSTRTLFALRLSLLAALVAAALAVAVGIPAAYALSRYRFRGHQLVDMVLELPLVVSPAALGAMLLVFFANPLGGWIQANVVRFVFGVAGVVLAQWVTVLGVTVRLLKTAFDEVPRELETVARTLGATQSHAVWTVTLPLASRGIVAAFILAWAKALGEFGATIMVAGTMAMRTETLPIAIYLRLSSADLPGTVALILMLVGIGLFALELTRRLLRATAHA